MSADKASARVRRAHVPAKWTPVRRQEHAPMKESKAYPDSEGTEYALAAACQSDLVGRAHEGGDLGGAERPVVVEIGDDRLHERLGQGDRPLLVTEVVVEDRQRQLVRAFALVGPFEAIPGEALDPVVLVERAAV